MQTTKYNSLGLDVNLSVPSSVEEFDLNAKKVGACLTEAINNCVYRGSLATFRTVFLHGQEANVEEGLTEISGLDTITGIERKTKESGKKDDKGNPILTFDETEGDFFKRILAEKGVEASTFQHHADLVASSIVFDASAKERKAPAPKKLPDWAKKTAEEFLAGTKSFDKLKAAYHKLVGTELVVAGETHEDKVKSLATGLVAYKAANDVFSKM